MSESAPDQDTLGQMLRIVAHDLRNPLAVIISNLGYLQSTLPGASADVKETLTDTLTSCQDLKHIIENVDLVGQLLKGGTDGGAGFSVFTATSDIINSCHSLAESHGVGLTSMLGNIDPGLRSDQELSAYERALSNLIRNSIQHSPPGAVVGVSAVVAAQHCTVSVEDTGSTLPPEWRERAFTAKGQVESKAAGTGRYGRGLGLYCAAAAAHELGATLDARPGDEGEGNRFELRLPVGD